MTKHPPTAALRRVALPPDCPGALWLSAMPGRCGSLDDVRAALAANAIGHIGCLTSPAEIAAKSPAYAAARASGTIPTRLHDFPIADFATPEDIAAFFQWVTAMASLLRAGERLVVHCAAGIGRTGTAACCILMALGLPAPAANAAVRAAGSGPETAAQRALAATGPPATLRPGARQGAPAG